MNVLVTGAGGFIGSHIVKRLEEEHNVYVAHRNDLVSNRSIYKIFLGIDIDVVIHCAAVTHEKNSGLPRKEVRRVNVLVSKYLADLCAVRNIRFVFFSTAAVYETTDIITTRTAMNPTTVYGIEKKEIEEYLQTVKGLDYCIVVPSFPIGTNQSETQLMKRIESNIASGKEVFVRSDGGPFIMPTQVEKYGEFVNSLINRNRSLGGEKHFVTGEVSMSMMRIISETSDYLKKAPVLVIEDSERTKNNYVFKQEESYTAKVEDSRKAIFFDVDGTILDTKERVKLSHVVARSAGYAQGSKEYEAYRKGIIEEEELLACDALQSNAVEVLRFLKKQGYAVYLISSRQYQHRLVKQMKSFYLHDIPLFVTSKSVPFKTDGYYVGDTEKDMEFAEQSGLISIAITTGSRTREELEKTSANYIIDNLEELLGVLK